MKNIGKWLFRIVFVGGAIYLCGIGKNTGAEMCVTATIISFIVL